MQEFKIIEEEENFESKLTKFLRSSYFTATCVVLVGASSFMLGRISRLSGIREPVRVFEKNVETIGEVKGVSIESQVKEIVVEPKATSGEVVGSKNGTKYHYPWCAGASQIAEKNKILFNSIEEARAKGYTPALNCKGLK